ncbi:hypothetical protein Fmac_010603 [Flemingia macrophylla]|uniref:Uncharacterized protein n=1 Tax=Flemingia macrophylla TaxID=520843 RepID=A0ABD1MK29_9FABA
MKDCSIFIYWNLRVCLCHSDIELRETWRRSEEKYVKKNDVISIDKMMYM